MTSTYTLNWQSSETGQNNCSGSDESLDRMVQIKWKTYQKTYAQSNCMRNMKHTCKKCVRTLRFEELPNLVNVGSCLAKSRVAAFRVLKEINGPPKKELPLHGFSILWLKHVKTRAADETPFIRKLQNKLKHPRMALNCPEIPLQGHLGPIQKQ